MRLLIILLFYHYPLMYHTAVHSSSSLVQALFGACTPSKTATNVPRDRLIVPIGVVADLTGAANDGGDADMSQHQVRSCDLG